MSTLPKILFLTGHLEGWYAVPNESHFEHSQMCGAQARLNKACLLIDGVKDAINSATVKAKKALKEKFGIDCSRRMVQRLLQSAQVFAYSHFFVSLFIDFNILSS